MPAHERAAELRRALTDPRKIVEACGYSDRIVVEPSGIKILCPWHQDKNPSCSISMRGDGTLSVKCFSCNKGGDVLHLIQVLRGIEEWADVEKEATRIAGLPDSTTTKQSRPQLPKGEYPPADEVAKFWKQSVDILQDSTLCDLLRARGIPPELVRELVRAAPEVGWNPRWAWVRGEDKPITWHRAGYRLLFQMCSEEGEVVSLHARRFGVPNDERKGTSPSRCRISSSLMLSPAALRDKVWNDAIIVEGAPNWLVLAAFYPERPVIGIINGSTKGLRLARIPRGARVTIWTDNELQTDNQGNVRPGAGSKYGEQLAAILAGRRLRVVKLSIPDGLKKAPDANDVFKTGGLPALENVLADAATLSLDANPDATALWERAAGLAGIKLPYFSDATRQGEHQPESEIASARLDDRDVVRLLDGKPILSCYNEFGERIGIAQEGAPHPGWLADEIGLNYLRNGEIPAAGLLITQGIDNFLVLAQHFEHDDPNAPAVLAGPVPKTAAKITFWPPQNYTEADHFEVRASDPAVASLIGRHAVQASIDAAQSVPIERPVPPPDDRPEKGFPRTDFGNAERLAYFYGENIRYVYDWKEFIVFNGQKWERDRTFEVNRRAIAVTRMLNHGNEDDRKWAHESESSGKHAAIVNLMREQPGIPILPERLDADPFLLNVRNGTLDLRTGRLLPHDRRHIMMKMADASFNAKARCPIWLRFLHRIFDGNENLIAYMQRAVGYSLSGNVGEGVFFLLYGTGRNGKSTFVLTIQALLGDYSQQTSADLLMANGDKLDAGQLSAIASLKGARFVAASETEEGGRLGEKTAKQIVKGDVIQAKFMHKDPFEFLPTHKVWLATNHKPRTRGTDQGLWSMLVPVPFKVTIPAGERDRTLPARLLAEKSGILNWALEGCLKWQAMRGLGQPPEIDDAINEYRKEMDTLQPFIDECCLVGDSYSVKISALRTAYEMWCKESTKHAVGPRIFGQLLEEKFPAKNDGSARFRIGLMLRNEWQRDVEHNERAR